MPDRQERPLVLVFSEFLIRVVNTVLCLPALLPHLMILGMSRMLDDGEDGFCQSQLRSPEFFSTSIIFLTFSIYT